MKNMTTVYRRELAAYFNSPIAYIFLIGFLLAVSTIFFVLRDFFAQTNPDVRAYFAWFPLLLAGFCSAVSMRLWAEEKRAGTIELLSTWPVRAWELVLAKYFAGLTIVVVALILTVVGPWSVSSTTDVDWGVIFSSYFGAVVIASVYMALGAWVSTFTHNQVVALLESCMISVALWGVGMPPFVRWVSKFGGVEFGNFVGWFGTEYHFQEFSKGLINPVGLIYGVGMTAVFLVLNNLFVEGRKF